MLEIRFIIVIILIIISYITILVGLVTDIQECIIGGMILMICTGIISTISRTHRENISNI